MNPTKRFRVEPGSTVKLEEIDAAFHGSHADEKEAAQETAEHLARITQLQRKLYADRNHSLCSRASTGRAKMAPAGMSSAPWTRKG
jgi:hypothetical protein